MSIFYNFCNYKNYLTNGTFTKPALSNNTYTYYSGTTVSGWIFGNVAIANNSTAWGYPTPYPCGNQLCSMQFNRTIQQTFSVPKAGKYMLIIYYCGRPSGSNTLNILLNNTSIGTITKPISKWNQILFPLNITNASNNVLIIQGTATTDLSTGIQLILTDNFRSLKSTGMINMSEKIYQNSVKYSDNGQYYLVLENDAELCVYDQNDNKLWTSGKTSSISAYGTFQTDGNLCIYTNDGKNTYIWCAMSNGSNRSNASIDDDGILRVWDNYNQIVWASSTNTATAMQAIPETAQVGNFSYDSTVVPVFVIGNYGIAPWASNNLFPDKTGQWIWYSCNSNSNAPTDSSPVTIQYLYTNNTGIQIKATLYIIIDNFCDLYINKIAIKTGLSGGWGGTIPTVPITILPGKNLFEFKVKNSSGPAGLYASCMTAGPGPDGNPVLFNTNSNWKFIPLNPTPLTSCSLAKSGLIVTSDKYFPWGSLALNGTSSQYVNLGTTITGMGGLTFGCWFKSNNNKDFARIFDLGNGQNSDNIALYINGGKLGASIFLVNTNTGNKLNLSSNVNNNTWNHVVWTIQPTQSGANWTIYLNNKMTYSGTGAYPINLSRTQCYIGKSNWSTDPYFSGSISNFVMYQKVLSVGEINALYNSMINLNDTKLYLYLPFSTNSVLDTLLNNYAGKTFNLPITKSEIQNQNWNCMQEGSYWNSIRMSNGKTQCMSLDGVNCLNLAKTECEALATNPVVPENPVTCSENQGGWCVGANKLLSSLNKPVVSTVLSNAITTSTTNTVPVTQVKPAIQSLSALISTQEGEALKIGKLMGGGQPLAISSLNDVNNLMVGGTFKLRVNLPMMPPYIKGSSFNTAVGLNPNYFYLCVEKLDNNCNITGNNNSCSGVYADNKNCSNKSLTSKVGTNSYRFVLICAQYVLDPSIPIGKNSDFTLVQDANNQYYLQNIQSGLILSLYQNTGEFKVYGNMAFNNSNVGILNESISNNTCQTTTTTSTATPTTTTISTTTPTTTTPTTTTPQSQFINCQVPLDHNVYLIPSNTIQNSNPIRIDINSDNTITLNLKVFNNNGQSYLTNTLTHCNFNVQTYSFIEKITNALGTFLVNVVCISPENNSNPSQSKNKLNFTVELIKFPDNFIKNNSIYDINS